MTSSDDAVRRLATRIHGEGGRPRDREALEANLLPLVRCALRNGTGLPHVVQWVRRNLAALPDQARPIDPERAAPALARLLCNTLLQQVRARPSAARARETVVGV